MVWSVVALQVSLSTKPCCLLQCQGRSLAQHKPRYLQMPARIHCHLRQQTSAGLWRAHCGDGGQVCRQHPQELCQRPQRHPDGAGSHPVVWPNTQRLVHCGCGHRHVFRLHVPEGHPNGMLLSLEAITVGSAEWGPATLLSTWCMWLRGCLQEPSTAACSAAHLCSCSTVARVWPREHSACKRVQAHGLQQMGDMLNRVTCSTGDTAARQVSGLQSGAHLHPCPGSIPRRAA